MKKQYLNRISNKGYKKGILIDGKYIVLINNEENKGCFFVYDLEKNYKSYESNNYPSFIKKSLFYKKIGNEKIIILGCKKDKKILSIKLTTENNEIIPYCKENQLNHDFNFICPIIKLNKSSNLLTIDPENIVETEYIFVFGSNKLCVYKILFNRINFIKDLKFQCYENFNWDIKNISYITQSYYDGKVIICLKMGNENVKKEGIFIY